MIKTLIIGILSGALVFLLIYLFGAFAQTSFNIVNWSENARFMVVFVGGILSLSVMASIVIYEITKP